MGTLLGCRDRPGSVCKACARTVHACAERRRALLGPQLACSMHMLYRAYQTSADLLSPSRLAAQFLGDPCGSRTPIAARPAAHGRGHARSIASMRLTHSRPPYGIDSVTVDGEEVAVHRGGRAGRALRHACCTSARTPSAVQPPVLLAAPLSGHFATLLRETVRTLLRDHDVYITDWHNARDVPLLAWRASASTTTRCTHPLPRGHRPGRAHGRRLPALRGGAGGHRPDGGGRQPGAAAQPHADGRPGRLPHQPDRRSTSSPPSKPDRAGSRRT